MAARTEPLRFAFADPPYLGMCGRYDHDHGGDGRCWDDPETHRLLIERLETYDGWALCLHVPSLAQMLSMVPGDVRVMAWVKTWASWKPGVYPAAAWEPVIIRGARKRRWAHGDADTPRDWHACVAHQKGFFGAKPPSMVWWVLDCLGVDPSVDSLDDLFHGSGAVLDAYRRWRDQERLPVERFDDLELGLTD